MKAGPNEFPQFIKVDETGAESGKTIPGVENALDEIIAAAKLGIPRQTLESKIKSLRLDKHSLQSAPSRLGAAAIQPYSRFWGGSKFSRE